MDEATQHRELNGRFRPVAAGPVPVPTGEAFGALGSPEHLILRKLNAAVASHVRRAIRDPYAWADISATSVRYIASQCQREPPLLARLATDARFAATVIAQSVKEREIEYYRRTMYDKVMRPLPASLLGDIEVALGESDDDDGFAAPSQTLRSVDSLETAAQRDADPVADAAVADYTGSSPFTTGTDPEVNRSSVELAALVKDAASALKEKQRSAINLFYRHGLPNKDVGEVLGIKPNSASELLRRAEEGMREPLERGGALDISPRAKKAPLIVGPTNPAIRLYREEKQLSDERNQRRLEGNG